MTLSMNVVSVNDNCNYFKAKVSNLIRKGVQVFILPKQKPHLSLLKAQLIKQVKSGVVLT